eukprot:tig00020961_g16703.t1
MAYCGGDEVSAVVVDIGSLNVKAGWAGEDVPKAVFPSQVGVLYKEGDASTVGNGTQAVGEESTKDAAASGSSSGSRIGKYYIGTNEMCVRRDSVEVIGPYKEGILHDWECVEQLLDHVFKTRLQINTEEHPLLIAEPSFNTKAAREKLCQLIFEKYKPPAIFVAKTAVLSAYASGRATGLVLDSGAGVTCAVPVHEGYVLQKHIVKSFVGGEALTEVMQRCIERKAPIRPPYSFVKKAKGDLFEVKDVEAEKIAKTTASYRSFVLQNTARDAKESICRVAEAAFAPAENVNLPGLQFELPEGRSVEIALDRFLVPELMFQPALIACPEFGPEVSALAAQGPWPTAASLPKMIVDSISRCDTDIKKDLYANVVLTGGNTAFPQFSERLQRDLSDAAPGQAKVKVIAPAANTGERKYAAFIGGSILASLGSFQQMWMSKQEYEESGPALLEKKCP